MSKIKQGTVHTATQDVITIELENQTKGGRFEVQFCGQSLGADQARRMADVLVRAADTAEILDAAVSE